jgi:hypothetical protein
VIVSVFVRRLKEGRTFADFVQQWEADEGFGVPTRVFNAQSLEDPRDIVSVGFVDVSVKALTEALKTVRAAESVRHRRIDTVIESTSLRCMYELRSEHDFTSTPVEIEVGSPESLLAALARAD